MARNPFSSSGEAANRATASGTSRPSSATVAIACRAASGAASSVCGSNIESPSIDNMIDGKIRNRVAFSGNSRGHNALPGAGYEVPLLLFAGFRQLIDELHDELARQGHQGARPAYGFAMQAIGLEGRPPAISAVASGSPNSRLERPSSVSSPSATPNGLKTLPTPAAKLSASPRTDLTP